MESHWLGSQKLKRERQFREYTCAHMCVYQCCGSGSGGSCFYEKVQYFIIFNDLLTIWQHKNVQVESGSGRICKQVKITALRVRIRNKYLQVRNNANIEIPVTVTSERKWENSAALFRSGAKPPHPAIKHLVKASTCHPTSIMDPDPVGSQTFVGFRIRIKIKIWNNTALT